MQKTLSISIFLPKTTALRRYMCFLLDSLARQDSIKELEPAHNEN